MKTSCRWQFGALFLVNVWVAVAVTIAARQTAYHWRESLEGAALPAMTNFALQSGPIWSVAVLILSLVGLVVAFRDSGNHRALPVGVFVLAVVELALFGFFALGSILPSFAITYKLR